MAARAAAASGWTSAAPAAVLLLSCSLVATSALRSLPRLGYEAHGFNDLDQLSQLLVHGTRWFKLDVGFSTRASCASYSTWDGNASDCATYDGVEVCCLCLRGDASTRPSLVAPFNTTRDLIRFVSDPDNAPLFPRAGDGQPPVYVGLDWGGSPSLPSGLSTPLLAGFLLGLRDALASSGFGVTPYFDDQLNAMFGALDAKCGGGGCSGVEAELFALTWPSEGSPPLPASGRESVSNGDWTSFEACCGSGAEGCWGTTWGREAGQTMLWYEPTSQSEFAALGAQWLACASLPTGPSGDLNEGLTVVSNDAPEMAEVYVAGGVGGAAAGRGLDALVVPASRPSSPRLVVVPAAAGAACDRWAVVSFVNSSGAALLASLCDADAAPAGPAFPASAVSTVDLPAALASAGALVSLQAAGDTPPGAGFGGLPVVLAAAATGAAGMWTVDPQSGALASAGAGSLPGFPPSPSLLSAQPLCTAAACYALLLLGDAASAGVAVELTPLSLCGALAPGCAPLAEAIVDAGRAADGGGSAVAAFVSSSSGATLLSGVALYSSTSTAAGAGAVAAASRLAMLADLDAARRASADGASLHAAWASARADRRAAVLPLPLSAEATRSAASVDANAASPPLLYGALVNVSIFEPAGKPAQAALAVATNGGGGAGAPAQRLGFGRAPSLAALSLNGSVLLLSTHTDGTCTCGLLINNDDTPHCVIPTPAGDADIFIAALQSVPSLVNYAYGTLEAWRAAVSSVSDPFSPCSRALYAGKLEWGAQPTPALYASAVRWRNAATAAGPGGRAAPFDPLQPHTEVSAIALFDALVQVPATAFFCGPPVAKGGVALAGWRPPQLWEMMGAA